MSALRNLRAEAPFARLAEHLQEQARGRALWYSPNPGNWGDGLIHAGTRKFLADHGLAAREVPRWRVGRIAELLREEEARLADTVLLTVGAGAWWQVFPGARDLVKQAWPAFAHVVVLPTSYGFGPIEEAGENITYFRRDETMSRAAVPESRFCHDMAFWLDLDLPEIAPVIEAGNFFRRDRERGPEAPQPPPDNIDLSQHGSHLSPPEDLFRLLARWHHIRTDRLHIAIAGAMLGRQVTLWPGAYGKVAAVHAATLAAHYPNVTLAAPPAGQGAGTGV